MSVSQEVIRSLAELSNWKLEVYLRDRGDAVVWAGDGTDDIDRWISFLESNPRSKARIDQSIKGLSGSWADCTISDLERLREEFVARYGDVDKIDAYGQDGEGVVVDLTDKS